MVLSIKDLFSTSILSYLRQALTFATTIRNALTVEANKIARKVDEHELLINKVAYCAGVLTFGLFCYTLGSRPEAIPGLYCAFYIFAVPLRWIYYRSKKWHYYLLDFCYYANAILVSSLLFFPTNKRLLMLCFAFSEGPLAWALIVWRCSLVFSSVDKIISVFIHLLPGTVVFILRWWTTTTTSALRYGSNASDDGVLDVANVDGSWAWLFVAPLMAYVAWQALYVAVVGGIRKQRIVGDPEIMTSYRELKRRAKRNNSVWWHVSGALGEENRVYVYGMMQAAFIMATFLFTQTLFHCYALHLAFQALKIMASTWYGATYMFDVSLPRRARALSITRLIQS